MNVKISPSKISGTLFAPASKSFTHRAIILAALASGTSTIKNVLYADDIVHTINACKALGVKIDINGTALTIEGRDGKLKAGKTPIHVGNSGTTLRLLTAVSALTDGSTTITGEERLCQRPIHNLLDALNDLGIAARSHNNGLLPVTVTGGIIKGGVVKIPGNISSQYISALLLISPFAKKDLTIEIINTLASKPYVAITIDMLKTFGVDVENEDFNRFTVSFGQSYKAQEYEIEGDYSSASYFFAAAAIKNSSITVDGLNPESVQGDKYLLQILKHMGCEILITQTSIEVKGPKILKPIEIDMNHYPDIVQTVAVVSAFANGSTKIKNIDHLKHKESNRIQSIINGLAKMGIKADFENNILTIRGGKPQGTEIETYNDHRMAMSFAIAALSADGETIIKSAEVVNKSYPRFFQDLKKIGGQVEEI